MLDSSTAFAVSRGRSILKTTDKGETWLDLTAPLSFVMPWNAVSFYDPANGIAVGDHGSVFNIVGGSSHFARDIINGQNCFSAPSFKRGEYLCWRRLRLDLSFARQRADLEFRKDKRVAGQVVISRTADQQRAPFPCMR